MVDEDQPADQQRAADAGTDDGASSIENALGVLFGLGVALVVLAIALVIFAMQPGKTGLGAIGTGLAVGGGALGDPAIRDALRGCRVFHLRVGFGEAQELRGLDEADVGLPVGQ